MARLIDVRRDYDAIQTAGMNRIQHQLQQLTKQLTTDLQTIDSGDPLGDLLDDMFTTLQSTIELHSAVQCDDMATVLRLLGDTECGHRPVGTNGVRCTKPFGHDGDHGDIHESWPTDDVAVDVESVAAMQDACNRACEDSKNGYVQHVNREGTGYVVSDWFDAHRTVASFQNGRAL